MSREIMQQALDALKQTFQFQQTRDVIAALEAELAKPEPTQERIYETIVQWDSGGKRSRRELARRVETLFKEPRAHITDGTPCWCDPVQELAKREQAINPFPSFMRRRIEEAIGSAINPKGMSVHDGKATVYASDLQRMLLVVDLAAQQLAKPKQEPVA